MVSVITADFIDSTSYDKELLTAVFKELNREFEIIGKEFGKKETSFKVYRGDSFQGVIRPVEEALRIALLIKAAMNKIHLGKDKDRGYAKAVDLRIAIGIGSVDFEREDIAESNGQAFQFSGRTLDEMKSENRKIQLKTPVPEIDDEFNSSLYLLEMVMDKWSTASAEVMYYLFRGLKETEIAARINISQSAVNQRKKAAGWEAVKVLLERYRTIASQNFKNGK